jgi:hypothetical protein
MRQRNTTGLISPRQITAKHVKNIKPSKSCAANHMSIWVMVIPSSTGYGQENACSGE